MTLRLLVDLLLTLFENDDFGSSELADHFGGDAGAGNFRLTGDALVPILCEQNVIDFYFFAFFAGAFAAGFAPLAAACFFAAVFESVVSATSSL